MFKTINMKRLLFFCIFSFTLIFLPVHVASQDNRPLRMEIPVRDDSEIYKVVPCGENGLVIIYLSSETDENGNIVWIMAMLDKELKEKWRKSFPLQRGFSLQEALYSNGHLILFMHSAKGSADGNFRVVDLLTESGEFFIAGYTIPERSGISYFSIGNEFAVAGVNLRNDESQILAYNFKNRQISVISPGVPGSAAVVSLNIDKNSNKITAVIRTSGSGKKRNFYFVKTDLTGNIYTNLQLSKFDDDRLINTAFSYSVDATTDMVIGSYGRSSRTRTVEGIETIGIASTGFFSILIKNNEETNSNFYEFTSFENFYRYLRRPADISSARRTSNRIERGKEYSVNHDLLTHEVFKWKDQYVFLAEAYYPEYRTVTTMVYDYYGRPYPSTYSVFEGFRYLTTFVAGFDGNGNLIWNNDLELRSILSQTLKPRVLAREDPEGLVLAYISEGKIISKLINGAQTIEAISQSDIAPLSSRDRVFNDSNSIIEHWYNSYFVAYGYQNIRNSYVSGRSNKNVFYINKVAYY